MSASRFPFTSSPKGWFAVALSRELGPGQVLPVKAFEKDLVLFRGEDGQAKLLGAFCPHMGAHLGHGGKVVDNTIKCPFHAWQFDGTGQCAKIPYADRIPPKAKVRPWTVMERNGMILAWNDIEGSAPEWEVPVIPEIGSDEWTDFEVREWDIKTHSLDMAENQVDVAHFQYLHGTLNYPKSIAEEKGHIMQVTSVADMGTTRGATADEALRANRERVEQVLGTLRAQGVVREALQRGEPETFPIALHAAARSAAGVVPGGGEAAGRSAASSYGAESYVTVRTDVEQASRLLAEGIRAGASPNSSISFGLRDETPVRKQALEVAIKSAYTEAQLLAEAAGLRLQGPHSLDVARGGDPLITICPSEASHAAAVAPTSLTLSAQVTVDYTYLFEGREALRRRRLNS